jgi:hypothetical protein
MPLLSGAMLESKGGRSKGQTRPAVGRSLIGTVGLAAVLVRLARFRDMGAPLCPRVRRRERTRCSFGGKGTDVHLDVSISSRVENAPLWRAGASPKVWMAGWRRTRLRDSWSQGKSVNNEDCRHILRQRPRWSLPHGKSHSCVTLEPAQQFARCHQFRR